MMSMSTLVVVEFSISALIFLRGPHVGIVGGWVGLTKTLDSTGQNN